MSAAVQFSEEKRGYKKDEVELYIGMLQDGIQNLDEEGNALKARIEEMEKEASEHGERLQSAQEELKKSRQTAEGFSR